VSHDGNWSQLRHLVLRLLEEHEEAISELSCMVTGDADHEGLATKIRVLEEQLAEARQKVGEIDRKANKAHDKGNRNAETLAGLGSSKKQIAALIGVVTTLSTALSKLVDLVFELVSK
jgi:chromosome segregation ATPase